MSASRTKVAVRSTSVYNATVSIGAPVSAASSRTAWMSRIAASPRLTMAIRLNTRSSPYLGKNIRQETTGGKADSAASARPELAIGVTHG